MQLIYGTISAHLFCEPRDKACTFTEIGAIWIYKKQSDRQISFDDFNQPLGLKINPDNRWIKKSELMSWAKLKDQCAQLFESHLNLGNDGISFQTLLSAQLIKLEYIFSGEKTDLMI